jgi:tripartite-type tricarboxylate transporter receptor subunit TctC
VPGYDVSTWFRVGAPKNTPTDIIATFNKEINAALADPNIEGRLAHLGALAMPMRPLEFGRFITDETEKWRKVVRFADIRADQASCRCKRLAAAYIGRGGPLPRAGQRM